MRQKQNIQQESAKSITLSFVSNRQYNNYVRRLMILIFVLSVNMLFQSTRVFAQGDLLVSTITSGENFTNDLKNAIIQKSQTGGGNIIFDGIPGKIYEVGPLSFNQINNINFIIHEGVTIQALSGAYESLGACIFTLFNSSNISFSGIDSTSKIKMLIDEYDDNSQYRHCISLRGCENVNIENLTLAESGGDGIYIGVNSSAFNCSDEGWKDCENITIQNVVCNGNGRQGISIISANHVIIDNCAFKNTGQYNGRDGDIWPVNSGPYAGIDLEPNNACERLQDISITNSVFDNNSGFKYENPENPINPIKLGFGILFSFQHLDNNTPAISVQVNNCDIQKSPYGIDFYSESTALFGNININNCSIYNTEHYGIRFRNWAHTNNNLNILIDDIEIDNPTVYPNNAAVGIRNGTGSYEDGGFSITNLRVSNNISNRAILFDGLGSITNRYRDIDIEYTTNEHSDEIVYPYFYNNVNINRSFNPSGFNNFYREFLGTDSDAHGTDEEEFLTHPDAKVFPGDFNGDGKTDLFVKGYGTYRVLYLANSNGNGFNRAFLGTDSDAHGTDEEEFLTHPDAKVFPGDFNGDGKTDLFVKGYGTYRVLYLANSNGNGFNRAFLGTDSDAHGTDEEEFLTHPDAKVFPGDFNGDGKTDLFVKGYGTYRVLYLANSNGNGFNRAFLGTDSDAGGTDEEEFLTHPDAKVFPGDYNGDGKMDLFIKGYTTHRVLYNSSSELFKSTESHITEPNLDSNIEIQAYNFPNPFSYSTTINYYLLDDSPIKIEIYNSSGLLIETLVNQNQSKGKHEVTWNAINKPSGIYLYRIGTSTCSQIYKMILL